MTNMLAKFSKIKYNVLKLNEFLINTYCPLSRMQWIEMRLRMSCFHSAHQFGIRSEFGSARIPNGPWKDKKIVPATMGL